MLATNLDVDLDDSSRANGAAAAFWCTCQGWLNSADETIISRKAYVKLACKQKLFRSSLEKLSFGIEYISYMLVDIEQTFEWEPMPTSGLIGKSVEIRCLPPDGEPKPLVYWLKNGLAIEKPNKRLLVSHEGSLLFNDVRGSDAANYTCVAENLAGRRLSEPATLIVTGMHKLITKYVFLSFNVLKIQLFLQ
jgi:hypothetical protein